MGVVRGFVKEGPRGFLGTLSASIDNYLALGSRFLTALGSRFLNFWFQIPHSFGFQIPNSFGFQILRF